MEKKKQALLNSIAHCMYVILQDSLFACHLPAGIEKILVQLKIVPSKIFIFPTTLKCHKLHVYSLLPFATGMQLILFEYSKICSSCDIEIAVGTSPAEDKLLMLMMCGFHLFCFLTDGRQSILI